MKLLDRHILRELLKFTLIAVVSVVVIYLLIDLFEELNYFTTRKVSVFTVLLYYLYSMPSAVSLLYPVSMILAVFLVYGQLTRNRELHALESAGVSVLRLFAPAIGLGLASVVLYLGANEFITIPANAALSDLRRVRIEKRKAGQTARRTNLYFVGEGGRVFYIREQGIDGTMHNFVLSQLDRDRKVVRRFDGTDAKYNGKGWVGHNVWVRDFDRDGNERLTKFDSLDLTVITEKPGDFAATGRPVEETSTRKLDDYIDRMKRAGENVAKEEVELNYRFSYSLIGLVVVLLGLPLSVRLRKGGVMFGLGLGLLFSFLYWGAIQTSRAYGTSHVISPAMAAWLPNIIFGVAASVLVLRVER